MLRHAALRELAGYNPEKVSPTARSGTQLPSCRVPRIEPALLAVRDVQEDTLEPMNVPSAWHTTPLKSKILFLLAVFFVFVGIAIANDVIDVGRTSPQRFAASALINSVFAVCYAASGIILRRKAWKVFIPLFLVEFASMGMLGHFYPDAPEATHLDAAATAALRSRIAMDGEGIILSVLLGYVGFVWVSVSEGKRYIRIQTDKAQLEGEMAAAHEVQRVMVPESLPAVDGYAIESVYRPAAEVGGDFFQVIPLASGRTMVVIGDVSGKGLRAAMIVSLIVGMLRTVSDFTEEPGEILAELNRRLHGRTQGAFATCLAVRLEDEGRLTLANAGHIPPYLNGMEFPFAGSLPLGLVENSEYEQVELEIGVRDRVVLVTDGIAEARNKQKELLGFSRVEGLLQEGASAKSVAEVAEQHGQEDDLTVIGIARSG